LSITSSSASHLSFSHNVRVDCQNFSFAYHLTPIGLIRTFRMLFKSDWRHLPTLFKSITSSSTHEIKKLTRWRQNLIAGDRRLKININLMYARQIEAFPIALNTPHYKFMHKYFFIFLFHFFFMNSIHESTAVRCQKDKKRGEKKK
jgi:hypothetical protein